MGKNTLNMQTKPRPVCTTLSWGNGNLTGDRAGEFAFLKTGTNILVLTKMIRWTVVESTGSIRPRPRLSYM